MTKRLPSESPAQMAKIHAEELGIPLSFINGRQFTAEELEETVYLIKQIMSRDEFRGTTPFYPYQQGKQLANAIWHNMYPNGCPAYVRSRSSSNHVWIRAVALNIALYHRGERRTVQQLMTLIRYKTSMVETKTTECLRPSLRTQVEARVLALGWTLSHGGKRRTVQQLMAIIRYHEHCGKK